MAAEGSTPPGLSELSDKVDPLASQLESVLEWIRCQPKPKTRETPLMEKFEDEASFKYDTEEDRANETHMSPPRGSHKPFKVEARIDIPSYDGTVDAEKLDPWLDQLETYFTLYGFTSTEKSRWHNLRQQRGQSVQEYTIEFQRLAVMLGISTTYEDVFTTYVAGLQRQIQNKLRMYSLEDISSASCHVEEKCWKAHPELFPKKWAKNDRRRHTVATTISNEAIELGQAEEIQVKQELTEAIVDTGSEKNLISSSLVERLGLETTPHPHTYSLGWIKKDVDTQVNRQCKFRFAITNQFIDEVTCDVVPLDICQIIFGSPYLWERDAVYFRRAQKYELEKDGKKYIANKSNITNDDDLV
ncbi:hypothetical protein Tco_0734989 [Tanacetum coccineum]